MTIDGKKVSFWYWFTSSPMDRERIRELEDINEALRLDVEHLRWEVSALHPKRDGAGRFTKKP